jgi:integrase/recombinase XerD
MTSQICGFIVDGHITAYLELSMAKQAKVLTEAELKRVYAICDSSRHALRNKLILQLSFGAGLRACEIAALRVGDVVSTDGAVVDAVVLQSSQTKGSQRQTVYLSKRVRKAISAYLGETSQLTAHQRARKLLQTQKGGGFSSATIQQLFRELYKAAAIPNASSHSGRRSFITRLAHNGVSTAVIRELARHQNLATTQRYIDVSTDKLRGAVEMI